MKKIILGFITVLLAATFIVAGTTTNFNWDYGTRRQYPWWDVWTGVLQAIDTELYGIKHGTTVLDDIKTKGPWVDVRAYATINAAVTAIGSTPAVLLVPTSQTLAANLSIPSTLALWIPHNGSITKASTYTLTINGPLVTDLHQIFSGFSPGDVTFGAGAVKEFYPQWWGALGNGVHDDRPAILSAIGTATLGRRVYVPSTASYYACNGEIFIDKAITFEGDFGFRLGSSALTVGTSIRNTATDGSDAVHVHGNGTTVVIRNLLIKGNALSGNGLVVEDSANALVERVHIGDTEDPTYGHGGDGLVVKPGGYFSVYRQVISENNAGRGIVVGEDPVYSVNNVSFYDCVSQHNGGRGVYTKNVNQINFHGCVSEANDGGSGDQLYVDDPSFGVTWNDSWIEGGNAYIDAGAGHVLNRIFGGKISSGSLTINSGDSTLVDSCNVDTLVINSGARLTHVRNLPYYCSLTDNGKFTVMEDTPLYNRYYAGSNSIGYIGGSSYKTFDVRKDGVGVAFNNRGIRIMAGRDVLQDAYPSLNIPRAAWR